MVDALSESYYLMEALFMKWSSEFNRNGDNFNPVVSELHNEFIPQVLSKRMEVFDTKIIVPDYLSIIITLMTESNPGKSLIVLYETIKNSDINKLPYMIKPDDFTNTFYGDFPVLSADKGYEDKFMGMWDSQKDKNGRNLVDTANYWNDMISGVLL